LDVLQVERFIKDFRFRASLFDTDIIAWYAIKNYEPRYLMIASLD